MAANKYRVPVRQWRKWSPLARAVFNDVYGSVAGSPWAFQAPTVAALKITKRAWRVTAWNAAWIAADAVRSAEC